MSYNVYSVSFAPYYQLLCGSGSEGIGGGKHYGLTLFFAPVCQLAYGGSLAPSVDSYHENYQRNLIAELLPLCLIDSRGKNCLKRFSHTLRTGYIVIFDFFSQLRHNIHGGIHADIRSYENFFELVH